MGRRARSRAPAHPPRLVLRSAACPELWSEVRAGRIMVHFPGGRVTAPLAPTPAARRAVKRLDATARFALATTERDAEAWALLHDEAFGNGQLVPEEWEGAIVGHVLQHWGLSWL